MGCQERASVECALTLRKGEWKRYASFWHGVLEKELTAKWFSNLKVEVKTMFTPKSVDEVLDAPLRTFTGFLQVVNEGVDQLCGISAGF